MPRPMFRLGDGVFIYWNSGWHEPANAQFIQQIDADSLRPIGAPRELVLDGPRRAIEKNWMLFESGGACHAVYSINPHRILSFSLQSAFASCLDIQAQLSSKIAPAVGASFEHFLCNN